MRPHGIDRPNLGKALDISDDTTVSVGLPAEEVIRILEERLRASFKSAGINLDGYVSVADLSKDGFVVSFKKPTKEILGSQFTIHDGR